MLLLSAGRASSTCDSSGWLNSRWRRKQRRHLCTLSSTAVWTTVTHWSQWSSATKAARLINGARRSEHMMQSCAISTGYRFDSGSHSRQQFWCSSASTTWLHNTYRPTVNRCQHALIVVICNLSNLVFWLFRPLRQTTMIAVLPSIDLVHGTVFLQYCIHWTCLTRFFPTWIEDFFVHSETADLAHLWHCTILRFIT